MHVYVHCDLNARREPFELLEKIAVDERKEVIRAETLDLHIKTRYMHDTCSSMHTYRVHVVLAEALDLHQHEVAQHGHLCEPSRAAEFTSHAMGGLRVLTTQAVIRAAQVARLEAHQVKAVCALVLLAQETHALCGAVRRIVLHEEDQMLCKRPYGQVHQVSQRLHVVALHQQDAVPC